MGDKKYSEIIRERRSVRTFDGKKISDDVLKQLREFADNCSNPYDIPMEIRLLRQVRRR